MTSWNFNLAQLWRRIATSAPMMCITLTIGCIVAGCTVGPNYHRPSTEVPTAYKEQPPEGWKEAKPQDDIGKGAWWVVFGDPTLNDLEQQAVSQNLTLKAAAERVIESRANLQVTRGDLYPQVAAQPNLSRSRESGTRPNPPGFPSAAFTSNEFDLPASVSYEVDLWGRIRRQVESARADVQASQADYENVLLGLKSDVAQAYFSVRYIDTELAIFNHNIDLLQQGLNLAELRHNGGIVSGLDVSQAQTLLDSTQATYIGLGVQRAQFEHTLAVLLGKPASEFSLAPDPKLIVPPMIPEGLPSDLLERRPDVAEAERRMVSTNAQIGVARAAFFPDVTLTAGGGYLSSSLVQLFNFSSLVWDAAASANAPIFTGGKLTGNLVRAQATYEESVANYRQQVLTAFKDVEDALAGLRILEQQEIAQNRAVDAARRTAQISTSRYKEGLAVYIEVIDAERDVLTNEQLAAQLREQRLLTTALLIKALGGGWEDSKIHTPVPNKVESGAPTAPGAP